MTPKSLQQIVDKWRGSPQLGVDWEQDRWLKAFPRRAVFGGIPPLLDRSCVRRECLRAASSEMAATNAFLVTMAWGYGNVGYGPWRVTQALQDRRVGYKLLSVAVALDKQGPQAAYRLMAGSARLSRIGPAFATKFLYFADPGRHDRRALILDRLVADWLRINTEFKVNPVAWSPARYDAYLDQMHQWADELRVSPDVVELAIFQEMSATLGNQWAGRR